MFHTVYTNFVPRKQVHTFHAEDLEQRLHFQNSAKSYFKMTCL